MINIIVSALVFASIVGFVSFMLIKLNKLTLYNTALYIFLLTSWFTMYLFKQNNTLNTHGVLTKWWVWAIVAALFQFTQAAFRVPLGVLSQKLKSRKQVVLFVITLMIASMVLVITSNFSAWSIILAIIASGFVGATFGLDSQYWSENWDIKRGFVSAAVVFTIPIAARSLSTVINGSFDLGNVDLYWITMGSIVFGTISVITFALLFKERTETIMLDNMDPAARLVVNNKTMKDAWALSISTALVAGAYTFVSSFSTMYVHDSYVVNLIKFISLVSSVITALFLVQRFNVRRIGLYLVVLSSLVLGVTLITDYMNITLWITLISIASFGFGMYIVTMFGAALHFDHKFPALVLAIFLSVKSFTIGTGQVSAALTVHSSSNVLIGSLIIGVILTCAIISEAILYFSKNGTKLIRSAIEYEKGEKIW